MRKHMILFVLFLLFGVHLAYAADDLGLNEYARDINTPADASAVKVYDAWSENMAYRIERGTSEGIVIDGANETDEYISDGVGNVIVKNGINIGPIINKTDLSDTIIIIRNSIRQRF